MATKRTLCFAFVLYPDNPHQMQLFDWLTNAQNQANFDFRVMYILHAPEEEEKKEHYHFMIKYPNPRTADGVRKSFGVVRTVWRLYIMSPSKVNQKLTKCGKGEITLSGYKRRSALKYELTPVLSDKNVPDSYIELPYHDGEKMPPKKAGLDDEIYKLTPVYTVSHVENVSDFRAYAQYILHNTYECYLAHKRQYKISDVKGSPDFIQLAYSGTYSESEMSVTGILQLLDSWRNTNQQLNFIEYVYAVGKPELVEFIRKNPYFVSKFLLGGNDMTYAETLLAATYVRLSECVEDIQEAQELFYSPQLDDNCKFYLGVLSMCMTIPAEHFMAIFRTAILPRISSLIPRPDYMETQEDRLIHCLKISVSSERGKHFYQDICANLAERKERSL